MKGNVELKKYIYVILITTSFYLTTFVISYSIFDKGRVNEHTLLNEYLLITKNHTTKLSNVSKDYIYAENFPKERVIKYIHNLDVLLLECESSLDSNERIYYKINMTTDQIIGPISKEQFVENLDKYIQINYLNWER